MLEESSAFPPRRAALAAAATLAAARGRTGGVLAFTPMSPHGDPHTHTSRVDHVGPLDRPEDMRKIETVIESTLDDGRLVEVKANDLFRGKWEQHDVMLPAPWAEKLTHISVAGVGGDSEHMYFVGYAKAKESLGELAFKAMSSDFEETARDIHMMERLSVTGMVPRVFDKVENAQVTFLLTESPGTRNLEMLLLEQNVKATRDGNNEEPLLPIKTLLPLMADLLRALVWLEKLGIRHGGLTEDNIYLIDKDRHALLTDFRSACLDKPELGIFEDASLACEIGTSGPVGSAYRHAPEMGPGSPGPGFASAINTWQLGLIFARMVFGGELPTKWEAGALMENELLDDISSRGQEQIRQLIRDTFELDTLPGYRSLSDQYSDIKAIVTGMLEKHPGDRLTPASALKQVEHAAMVRSIELPPPRVRPEVPLEFGKGEDGLSP